MPGQGNAPHTPQAPRIKAEHHHMTLTDQDPVYLSQHLMWIQRKLEDMRQNHHISAIRSQGQCLGPTHQPVGCAQNALQVNIQNDTMRNTTATEQMVGAERADLEDMITKQPR
jgi:hypothetical protein